MKELAVLVTRPGSNGLALCQCIEAFEGKAWHFPTIAFAPPLDLPAFYRAIAQLDEQAYWIFNSPQSVEASIKIIQHKWPQLPSSVKLAAMGAGTQRVLKAAGYQDIICPVSDWHSEGLLALPEFQSIKHKKIAIVRGEGGREYLEKIFTEREAQVLSIIAYRRVLPLIDVTPYEQLLRAGAINRVVCTSFEGIQQLLILLGASLDSLIKRIPLIVSSERVKTLAQDLGFQTIWVARNASHQAILDVLHGDQHDRSIITRGKTL